jgi:hypothetical protein
MPDYLFCPLVPSHRVLGQESAEKVIDSCGQGITPVAGGLRRQGEDRGGIDLIGGGWKGKTPGQQFVEDHSERPDVATFVHEFPEELLGGHIGHRTDRGALTGEPGLGRTLRDPEIDDLDLPRVGEDEIGRLDVAVDNTPEVGMGEPGGNLLSQRESLSELDRAAFDFRRESLALAEGHHEEQVALRGLGDLENRADVGMIERGSCTGFPKEPLTGEALLPAKLKELEGDEAFERQI